MSYSVSWSNARWPDYIISVTLRLLHKVSRDKKIYKLEMCPSEHVWPASQHPSERDITIMKNNNVRRFFSVNRQLSCIIVHIKISRIKFKLVLKRIGKCQILGKARVFSYVCMYKVKNIKVHFFSKVVFFFFTLLTIFLEHVWVRNPKNNKIGKCQI